jgi:acyl-CoA reductase-like NAD-dependent aldehyde dehydrogenase
MLHLPVIRWGRPYASLDRAKLSRVGTREAVAEVSQANPGLVARDLGRAAQAQAALAALPARQLLDISRRAGRLFAEADLPLDGGCQTAADYLRQLAWTTGIPEAVGRANVAKIRGTLEGIDGVFAGLTRGLPPEILDAGFGREADRPVSFMRQADALGAVLPANSPGVHALWVPGVAFKVALALRPGSREPWTPYRLLQAFIAAGCPAEALGFYPGSHAAGAEVLLRCQRSLLFGDVGTVGPWKDDPRIEIHGPGWSKVILGPDASARWRDHLDVMAISVAENGGRSCVNASGIRVTRHGREVAHALAERLTAITARALDDPQASLAAWPDPAQARRLSEAIDRQLAVPGAEDISQKVRGGGRLVEQEGMTFLLPTIIWASDPSHPLAAAEYLFPFAAVVEAEESDVLEGAGSTLAATVLGDDPEFQRRAMACSHLERLNLGPIPTSRVPFDQPHEGNLFHLLYRQRSFQSAGSREAA